MAGFFIPISSKNYSERIDTNIKKQVCKPDSVPDFHLVSIIYLVPALLQESISLPPGSGRAVLFANPKTDNSRYIWPFNP